jgi:hypothetical protein
LGILATVWGRTFCFPVFCLKIESFKTYENIILPAVLYGYETWSLVQRKKKVTVDSNWVLREKFGTEMEDVTRLQRAA